MRGTPLVAGVMLAALAPGPASAGGVSLPTRGVRALGLGGAFVAGAEGANAFWYNPSRLDDSLLEAEVGLVYLAARYTAIEGLQAGVTAENDGRPLPNPTFGLIYRLNDLLSVGVAAYAPYSGFERFSETGPQRYALVESDRTTMLHLAAGASVRLGRFRIGATIQNVMAHLRQRIVLSGYTGLFGHPEDPELDILEELELEDQLNLTGNLGASFDAGPITLGATVQLPYEVSGDAAFRVRIPSSIFFDSMEVEGDTVHLAVPFPLAVRGGVLWRVLPDLFVEASVSWENWSVQQELRIDPRGRIQLHGVPGIGDYAMPPMVIDRRMRDTVSVHLGSDLQVTGGLHLRGGIFYEPSAFGDATFSVAQLDGDKVGLALGASYALGPMRFDLAGSHVLQGTREVTSSELRQLNPTNPEQAIVVGNGTYQSSFWVAGLGVTWHIGGGVGSAAELR